MMCGIFCKILYHSKNTSERTTIFDKDKRVEELLKCRGPDANSSLSSFIPTDLFGLTLLMIGKTLWMQGNAPGVQPVKSKHGALLFNGDIFTENYDINVSDTKEILDKLDLTYEPQSNASSGEKITNVLKSLKGPFSLIYWDNIQNSLYFCRDRFGRKSLLLHKESNELCLSSVLDKGYKHTVELPTGFIYCLQLGQNTIKTIPWIGNGNSTSFIPFDNWFSSINVNEHILPFTNIPMTEQDFQLIATIESLSENFTSRNEFLKNVLKIENVSAKVRKLLHLLSESVKVRVLTQPGVCKVCISKADKCEKHCTVGILFSGGLDCTILAALAHRHIPIAETIDLLNVAFEHKNCEDFLVPDRITSLQSLEELQRLFPQRNWNLVQVNITTQELKEKQLEIIGDLVYPLQSILDESLGTALWFAARGKISSYESTSRILLMGMGADELFGGYTRHRNAMKRGGWNALEKELQLDWQRIPYRNLARDDRVVSHHGRQPRMPYLDEDFLEFVLNLKSYERCIPSTKCELGTGDKMLLRLAAIELGFERTSVFPKRAIQFGSKIANKKENAKDISERLTQVL